MIKHFPNTIRLLILHMFYFRNFCICAIIFTGCSSTIKIVDSHPNNAKKSTEIYNGKLFGSTLIKKRTYYPSGRIHSETNYLKNKKHGKYASFYENGNPATKGFFKLDDRSDVWEWIAENGKLDSMYTFKNGQYHGKHENYFNGVIQISQNYREGKMHGKFTEFTETGLVKSTGKYLDNLPNGKWEWFDSDKKIQRIVNYKDGVKNGDFKIYNGNNLTLVGAYLKDRRHKTWKWYGANNNLDSLANYADGRLSGEYRVWHDNGNIKIIGGYRANKLNGEWSWFSDTGKADSIKVLSNGILNGHSKFYYKNGQLKEQRTYLSGKLDGEKSTYFISGQIKDKTEFRLNEKMGPYEIWTSNGRLEEKGTYLKNQYHGLIQRNYSTGLLASASTYSRGVLDGISQVFSPSNFLKKESFFESNKEIARLEYHDNGRFKRVLILNGEVAIYERKWNVDGFEITDQNYITGTRTQSDYYLSGQIKYECIYKNDLKHGMEWWFSENRTPSKIKLFNNGVEIISHELSYISND